MFYKSYISQWKKLGDDESAALSDIAVLLGFNFIAIMVFIYTYFVDYNSSYYLLIFMMFICFWIAFRVTHNIYPKERCLRIITEYAGRKFPKYYHYGMWAYIVLSAVIFIGAIRFKVGFEECQLKLDPVYSVAVITDLSMRPKSSTHIVTYRYQADGEYYTRDDMYEKGRNPDIHRGDTCKIIYSRSRPGISRPLEINKKIILVRIENY
jgi:hypothetical protein